MARSSYIYIVFRFDTQKIVGAFTVKHEMESFRKREGYESTTYVERYRDNQPDVPGVAF